ncbi:MAG: hypothetical protein ACHQPI_11695 [Thermoanaerobaculia bacterium]
MANLVIKSVREKNLPNDRNAKDECRRPLQDVVEDDLDPGSRVSRRAIVEASAVPTFVLSAPDVACLASPD